MQIITKVDATFFSFEVTVLQQGLSKFWVVILGNVKLKLWNQFKNNKKSEITSWPWFQPWTTGDMGRESSFAASLIVTF